MHVRYGVEWDVMGRPGRKWYVYARTQVHDEIIVDQVFSTTSFAACVTWVEIERSNLPDAPAPKMGFAWAGVTKTGRYRASYMLKAYRSEYAPPTKAQRDVLLSYCGKDVTAVFDEASAMDFSALEQRMAKAIASGAPGTGDDYGRGKASD